MFASLLVITAINFFTIKHARVLTNVINDKTIKATTTCSNLYVDVYIIFNTYYKWVHKTEF